MPELWDQNGRFPVTNYVSLLRVFTAIQHKNSSNTAVFDQKRPAFRPQKGNREKVCDGREIFFENFRHLLEPNRPGMRSHHVALRLNTFKVH